MTLEYISGKMASKMKPARLESEIERCREDANWKKALELISQSSSKYPEMEKLADFVLGETKLEEFLLENIPCEASITKAKSALGQAKAYLSKVANTDSKMATQAQLLLIKLQYCQGDYQGALTALEKHDFDRIVAQHTKLPARLLTILAEAYAIKGLCLEKTQPASSSRYRLKEHEEKILTCFERAGDLALVSLQEKESHNLSSSAGMHSSDSEAVIGPILEQAIQQSPILYIKHGELNKGINRYRELLRSVASRATYGVRQVLARQLAEVLLRGVCEHTYIPLDMAAQNSSSFPHPRTYSSDRLFIPEDENEETLLLLLIAEAIATRDAVLDRTAEVSETRQHAFQNITAIYDLLALALVKRAQFFMLADSFERAMRFSFDEFHVWYQFANSLICAGKYARAARVLQECHRLRPKSTVVCLQAARLCFEYLHQYAEGIQWAERAIEVGEDPLAARAQLALGMGYSMHAMEVHLLSERQQLHRKALEAFQRSHSLDPCDYLTLFHLALQLAILRRIGEALTYVKLALKYHNDHIHSLHLLVLLLTAQNQMEEAMVLLHAALEEYPDNLSLLLTKSKLEEVLSGPEEALNTCKKMMKLWKDMHEIDSEDGSERKGPGMDRNTLDRRSLAQFTMNEFSERGSGSIRAESVAASRVERTLSEVASSMNSSFQQRPGSQQSWQLQAQIWLHLAELYLCLNKVSEAEACVTETSSIFPLSHQVYYMKGQVYEHRQKYNEAKICYENAMSLNPGHTKSLQRLGNVLHQLGDDKMAEKVLRDAVNTDPTSHKTWYSLGMVLEGRGQMEAAADCLATAADLQGTAPIVPFTVIPRLLQ